MIESRWVASLGGLGCDDVQCQGVKRRSVEKHSMSLESLSAAVFREESLAGNARAVAAVAVHFHELKRTVLELSKSFAVRQRGYFLPGDDEQLRHLLVSYWQARCALIEVVTSTHQESQQNGNRSELVFLVAFAGALVLIDAARFLRNSFHKYSVIRDKLNEPEPNFGLPQGVYDTVQESLTRPIHVWYLYHAMSYWECHQAVLRAESPDKSLTRELLSIIDGLRATLEVTMQDYTVARIRVRTRQAWTGIQRDLLSRALYGLQKLMGDLVAGIYVRPGHRPGLPAGVISELRQFLTPGDVIVSRREFALTNYFLRVTGRMPRCTWEALRISKNEALPTTNIFNLAGNSC